MMHNRLRIMILFGTATLAGALLLYFYYDRTGSDPSSGKIRLDEHLTTHSIENKSLFLADQVWIGEQSSTNTMYKIHSKLRYLICVTQARDGRLLGKAWHPSFSESSIDIEGEYQDIDGEIVFSFVENGTVEGSLSLNDKLHLVRLGNGKYTGAIKNGRLIATGTVIGPSFNGETFLTLELK